MAEKVQPQAGRGRVKAFLWLVGVVAGFYAASIAASVITHVLHLSPLAGTSVGEVAILLVAVVFALIDGGGFRSLGVTTPWKAYDIAAIPGVIIVHVVGSVAMAAVLTVGGFIKPESGQHAVNTLSGFGTFNLGTMVLVGAGLALQAGIGEELLFRGYIITRLERLGLGAWPCIIISALIFGAIHIPGYGWALALPKAVGLGLAAGAYFWYRRNLAPLMIAHTLIDFSAFVAMFFIMKLTGGHLPVNF